MKAKYDEISEEISVKKAELKKLNEDRRPFKEFIETVGLLKNQTRTDNHRLGKTSLFYRLKNVKVLSSACGQEAGLSSHFFDIEFIEIFINIPNNKIPKIISIITVIRILVELGKISP
jgi:hypothetical protein